MQPTSAETQRFFITAQTFFGFFKDQIFSQFSLLIEPFFN
jgi:hypothetical protein